MHKVVAFRLQNFMGFVNTRWIKVEPITLLFGHNSAGKSALIRALLLLRQSVEQHAEIGPMAFSSDAGVDLGNFRNLVHNQSVGGDDGKIIFGFQIEVGLDALVEDAEGGNKDYASIENLLLTAKGLKSNLSEWQRQVDEIRKKRKEANEYREEYVALSGEKVPEPADPVFPQPRLMLKVNLSFRLNSLEAVILERLEVSLDAEVKFPDGKVAEDIPSDVKVFVAELISENNQWGFKSELEIIRKSKKGEEKSIDLETDPAWKSVQLLNTNTFSPFLWVTGGTIDIESDISDVRRFLQKNIEGPIREFLHSVTYLGPIRREPQRFYYVPQAAISEVGVYGQHMMRAYLAKEGAQREAIVDSINKWLNESELGNKLTITPLDVQESQNMAPGSTSRPYKLTIAPLDTQETLYSVSLKRTDAQSDNFRDVGFGFSQVLPVLLASLLAPDGATVIIEQPELHLHPAAQVALADFFIDQARTGRKFILETHSEHFLLRFQRRIAETTCQAQRSENPPRNEGHALTPDDLNIVFVTRPQEESLTEFVMVDQRGQLDYDRSSSKFREFFQYDYADVSKLSYATAEIMARENDNAAANH